MLIELIKDSNKGAVIGQEKSYCGAQKHPEFFSLGPKVQIKVQISGRLNGAEIARSEWAREGRVPLHTIRADIDYATSTSNTIYGSIGVSVWIFKGEIICC